MYNSKNISTFFCLCLADSALKLCKFYDDIIQRLYNFPSIMKNSSALQELFVSGLSAGDLRKALKEASSSVLHYSHYSSGQINTDPPTPQDPKIVKFQQSTKKNESNVVLSRLTCCYLLLFALLLATKCVKQLYYYYYYFTF